MAFLDVLTKEQLCTFPGVEYYPADKYQDYASKYGIGMKYGKYEPAFKGEYLVKGKYLVDVETRRLAVLSVVTGPGSKCFEDDLKTQLGLKPCPYFITPLPYGDEQHIASDLVSSIGTHEVLVTLQWKPPGCSVRECDRIVLGTFIIKEVIKRGKFDHVVLLHQDFTVVDILQYCEVQAVKTNSLVKSLTMSRDFNRKEATRLRAERAAVNEADNQARAERFKRIEDEARAMPTVPPKKRFRE